MSATVPSPLLQLDIIIPIENFSLMISPSKVPRREGTRYFSSLFLIYIKHTRTETLAITIKLYTSFIHRAVEYTAFFISSTQAVVSILVARSRVWFLRFFFYLLCRDNDHLLWLRGIHMARNNSTFYREKFFMIHFLYSPFFLLIFAWKDRYYKMFQETAAISFLRLSR